jgi:hypothetical protein
VLEKDLDYYQTTIVRELEEKLAAAKDSYDRKKAKLQDKYDEKIAKAEHDLLLSKDEQKKEAENVENLKTLVDRLQDVLTDGLGADKDILSGLG